MPSATFAHVAVAAGPVEAVWDRLQDAETWASIGPIEEVWDAVHAGDDLESFRWRTTVGPAGYKGSMTVVESEPPHRMRLSLDAGEVSGELVAELDPAAAGSTSVHSTLVVGSRGMLSTMFVPAISQAVGNGLPDQVDAFASTF
jgi:carbon monoxide dehydrogenase subunit G